MPRWFRSSQACACSEAGRCALEWRPSRWLLAVLMLLPPLAAFALIESNLPRMAAWSLAAGVLLLGTWRWRREARRSPRQIVLKSAVSDAQAEIGAGGQGVYATRVEVDGTVVEDWTLHWRGPLAFASYRIKGGSSNGRRETLSWWPDTLPARKRRELRLASLPPPVSPHAAAMRQ